MTDQAVTQELEGLTAVVTGGASGLGAATVRTLLQRGARVASLDRQHGEAPSGAIPIICDVTDSRSVDDAVRAVVSSLGGIDVLVNNAGIGASGDITSNDDAEWGRVFDVNVIGIARMTRSCLPHLRSSRCAAIVNTCSAVATVGVKNRALYSATKGAVASLTLAMAADFVSDRIRVNAVAPGTADTPWVARLLAGSDDPRQTAEALRARQPLGRLVRPEEVAHATAYLASPLSGSTTGVILAVDGGMTSLRTA